MKKNPRIIGDRHVKSVYEALKLSLDQKNINYFPTTVVKTVQYIESLYPRIYSATSKFDTLNPDQANDLTLYLDDNNIISVNLFSIKKGSKIQPKNLGAKSFFAKYFLSEHLQEMFNKAFENSYLEFLNDLVKLRRNTNYITDKKELKREVSIYFPKFTEEINPYRDKLLYSLREVCFTLFRDFYNKKSNGFFHAFNVLLMTEDVNIITSYGKSKDDVSVEKFNPGMPQFNDIRLYKLGRNTVGIKYGRVALTLRFKFESSPTSSVKLAVGYDSFPIEFEIQQINNSTIQKIDDLINTHQYTKTTNESNAIGKCHESLVCYYFLKEYPSVSQVEVDKCVELLDKYYSLVKPKTLEKLFNSTSTIVPVIREKLNEKYHNFTLESIDLVPESYIKDKLNTGDLELILRVNGEYVTEDISLKAIAKKNAKITTKNPGIGTILGPTFFNIGDLKPVVEEVKPRFQNGELTHTESLEIVSENLGQSLENAPQEKLRQGIENLLGKPLMAITIYNENASQIKEHSAIESEVKVYTKTPTAIQNTLTWNDDSESITLRVKFGAGHQHGWSSIKLASEYQLDPFE